MIVAVLHHHRRLLALCAGSACAHLAVLGWIGARPPPLASNAAGQVETLRLTLATPVVATGTPAATARIPEPPAALAAVPVSEPAAAPVEQPVAVPSGAPMPAAPAPGAFPAAPLPAATDVAPAQASALPGYGARPVQMPGRYHVRAPQSVRIRYAVVHAGSSAGARAPAEAWLDWRTDGARYRLEMDGVTGRLGSDGVLGDAGIVPRRATERQADTELATTFDAAAGEVRFGGGAPGVPDSIGIQDRASLAMQLAGIGLGDPEQVRDVLEVVVAGTDAAAVARLRVLGPERIDTGVGPLDTWHLAGMVAPGQARLDVWLAPAQGWLPVQVRVSGPNGAATQTISAVEPGAALN